MEICIFFLPRNCFIKKKSRGLGGPVVKNLPSNARDIGQMLDLEAEIPHAARQLG